MTPFDIRYMANTTLDKFNQAFAFHWQDEETALRVRSWKTFADKVLSIPMAHDMATRYMVLDGTKNKGKYQSDETVSGVRYKACTG